MVTITFTCRLTADELEARNTAEEPLRFLLAHHRADEISVGDACIVLSLDGDVFIAEVQDIEDHDILVELQ